MKNPPHLKKSRGRLTSALVLLSAVIVLIGAGCAAGIVMASRFTPRTLAQAESTHKAPVTTENFLDSHPVKVGFDVAADTPLTWSGSGMVTATAIHGSGEITSGSSPFSVNDVPVLAIHSSLPFYRDLGPQDQGDDVAALREELSRMGYAVQSSKPKIFDRFMRAALLDVQTKMGLADEGSLKLEHVVWLPAEKIQVGEWKLTPGAQAEQELGLVKGHLSAVRVQKMPESLAPGNHVINLFGKRGAISQEGLCSDKAFLDTIAASPEFASISGNHDALAAGVDGSIQLENPIKAFKIPVGAVFAYKDDHACVQTGSEARRITIVGSNGGFVMASSSKPLQSVNLGSAIDTTSCKVAQ